jgi:prepilin-type N-terminal cleavage/methylation domain-containing protein
MRSRQGYTVTELMVGVGVIGILAAASAPNISSYLRSQSAASGTEQLAAHIRMARSRAILEGNDYLVVFDSESQYLIVDDDGGGDGIPGSADFQAVNRNNGAADDNERVMGPFELPRDMRFASVSGIRNPFNGEVVADAVSFPDMGGKPTLVLHSNGTADPGGFVTMAPQQDIDHDSDSRTRVLQVVGPTGGVEARAAGR